jgi:hypothetical protein
MSKFLSRQIEEIAAFAVVGQKKKKKGKALLHYSRANPRGRTTTKIETMSNIQRRQSRNEKEKRFST